MSEPLIVSDPAVLLGKPVVAGTRITVELILEGEDTGAGWGDLDSKGCDLAAVVDADHGGAGAGFVGDLQIDLAGRDEPQRR